MVIVLTPKTANMHRDPRRLSKGINAMWNHLRAQIPDLLAGEGQLDDGVWTVGDVDDSQAEGLVEGDMGGAVAGDSDRGSQRGLEGCAEGDADVFCGVVVVDCSLLASILLLTSIAALTVKISLAVNRQTPSCVLRKSMKHVV